MRATVTSIDRAAGCVVTSEGETLAYDGLALCTAARTQAVPCPAATFRGFTTSGPLPTSRRSAIGGPSPRRHHRRRLHRFETAASLRALGPGSDRPRGCRTRARRVTARGVDLLRAGAQRGRCRHPDACSRGESGRRPARQRGDPGRGERIPADLVIVGVGLVPSTELAVDAGLEVEDGIVIDDHARTTSDGRIVAWGLCQPSDGSLRPTRQAGIRAERRRAGENCGSHAVWPRTTSIAALPWFWSDQYDLKLQIAGLNTGYDEVVINGDPAGDRDFSCYYLQRGRLIAADCVNRPETSCGPKQALSKGL